MTRSKPASPAWAAYFGNHPEVAANWGEQNSRICNCQCPPCMVSRESMDNEGWADLVEPDIFDEVSATDL